MLNRETLSKRSRSRKTKLLHKPSASELNKIVRRATEARRAREALGLPTRLALPRPASDTTKYRAIIRKLFDDVKAKGLEQSKPIQAFLDRRIVARQNALDVLSGVLALPRYQFIDRAAWILTTGGFQLDSNQRASFSSWAKLEHHSSSEESVELHFYYLWQNSSNATMVITVDAPIALNGYASVYAPPTRDEERGNSASLILSVEMEVFDWTGWPVADAGISSGALQVAHLWAQGERYDPDPSNDDGFGEGDAASQNVFGYFNLRIEDLVVHPGQTKLFDIFLKMTSGGWNGRTDVDFSSNAFQVTSPYAVIDRGAGVVGSMGT